MDSLHAACAMVAGCDDFITVDKGILKKPISEISTRQAIHRTSSNDIDGTITYV